MIVLSVLLRGHHRRADPPPAAAAERVRRGVKAREEIPDFTDRSDEIGHLSGSLRDMTAALYDRIEAIESFAADVAHELKNPLTSLRSAVETLPLARTRREPRPAAERHPARRAPPRPADQRHLRRLAARCRAGARRRPSPWTRPPARDRRLRRQRGPAATTASTIRLDIAPAPARPRRLLVLGHDSRLGQVINNLVENARSFSPPRRRGAHRPAPRVGPELEIVVEDDGPGIPAHGSSASSSASTPTGRTRASARIPGSASRSPARSSRRISGRIWAENRLADDSRRGRRAHRRALHRAAPAAMAAPATTKGPQPKAQPK